MHNTKQRAACVRGIFLTLTLLCAGARATTSPSPAAAAPGVVSARDSFMLVFPKPEEDDLDAARELYKERCERCHGRSMSGDGPLSAGLDPRPQDLKRRDWFDRVSSAERLRLLKRVVIGGGLSIGLSALMPPNPDLRNKPQLVYALIYLIASHHIPLPPQRDEAKEKGEKGEKAEGREQGQEAAPPQASPKPLKRGRGAPPRSL